VTQKSVRLLFSERMKRDGRYKEFVDRVEKRMEEESKTWTGAVWPVMREMGYEGPNQERALYQKLLEASHKTALQTQVQATRNEIREERLRENFELALAELPDTAPVAVEMDWIRAHPAMMRQSRQSSPKQVSISADDVLCPPHGKAPSKGAANALQHWVNHTAEFFKQMLSEHKKKQETQAAQQREMDEDLDEIEALLKEIRRGA